MSTAPLNRDMQMKLMTNASDRFDALVKKWESNETIKSLMTKPHPAFSDDCAYIRRDESLAKVG